MADSYAAIPEFGQIVEYVTQGSLLDGVYGVVINTMPLAAYDLVGADGSDVNLKLKNVLDDFIYILAKRDVNLSSIDFSDVIPAAIRTRINVFLTTKGWPTVPVGFTWLQLFSAIKARL